MLLLTGDLNRILAPIDRAAERRTASLSRHIVSTATRQLWSGLTFDLDAQQTELENLILDVMVASHLTALGFSLPCYALSSTPVDKSLRQAPAHVKNGLREIYGSIARSIADKPMSKVREALLAQARAIALGESKKKADIRAALAKAGIDFEDSPILRTVIRTQGALAFNAAAWISSQKNENLWGYQYVTEGDERVRKTHQDFEPNGVGVRYPADDPFWKRYWPPNGWRCRCICIPLFFGDSKARKRPFKGTPDIPPEWQFNGGIFFAAKKAA